MIGYGSEYNLLHCVYDLEHVDDDGGQEEDRLALWCFLAPRAEGLALESPFILVAVGQYTKPGPSFKIWNYYDLLCTALCKPPTSQDPSHMDPALGLQVHEPQGLGVHRWDPSSGCVKPQGKSMDACLDLSFQRMCVYFELSILMKPILI